MKGVRETGTTIEELSVDQIADRYPGEWILLQVTAFGSDRWPERGRIVAHGMSHSKVCRALPSVWLVSGPYYIFQAQHHGRTGDDLRRIIEDAWQRDAVDAWRRW